MTTELELKATMEIRERPKDFHAIIWIEAAVVFIYSKLNVLGMKSEVYVYLPNEQRHSFLKCREQFSTILHSGQDFTTVADTSEYDFSMWKFTLCRPELANWQLED